MLTLHDLKLDGFEALNALVAASVYGSVAQAVASLTIFSHPDTVAQTEARALFPIVRDFKRRGEVGEIGGRLVGFDDNTSPTEAFSWANRISRRPRDLQFNHVYSRSDDPDSYTNLANLCVSPSFLAKLTDTDAEVQSLLRYRAFDVFGWHPTDEPRPDKPAVYDDLIWARTLPPTEELRKVVEAQIAKRDNRTTRMIEQTGWLWGERLRA